MSDSRKDKNWKVLSASSALLRKYGKERRGYIEGSIETLYGYVYAYSQFGNTDIRFICWGRMYCRSFDRGFTKKGLARIANKFAEEIAIEVDRQRRAAL